MIQHFEDLGQMSAGRVHICFASRHYPTIVIRYGLELVLEHKLGHCDDLIKYVRSNLRIQTGPFFDEIQTQILNKSDGIFMWVVLVTDILNEEYRRGRNFAIQKFTVKRRLDKIPARLSDLFKEILLRDSEQMDSLLLCLQWILFAERPLTREEFYHAMLAGLDPGPDSLVAWDRQVITEDAMTRFVHDCSKGLAELTKGRARGREGRSAVRHQHRALVVQFIHESVRDFLIKDGGLYALWPELRINPEIVSHDKLKICCQTYLNVDVVAEGFTANKIATASQQEAAENQALMTSRFPFLRYASTFVFSHADKAAEGTPQGTFLQRFDLWKWINIFNLFETMKSRRYFWDASMLYLLAERNAANLIRDTPRTRPRLLVEERYGHPFFAALVQGNWDALKAIIGLDRGVELEPEIDKLLRPLATGNALARPPHPLVWALQWKNEALAKILVESMASGELSDLVLITDVLPMAISLGYERTFTPLLDAANTDCGPSSHGIHVPMSAAMDAAITRGNVAVVRLLLQRGIQVNRCAPDTRTSPIHQAVRAFQTLDQSVHTAGMEIVHQLLDQEDIDLQALDEEGASALHLACDCAHYDLVKLLIDRGSEIDAVDDRSCTALLRAARIGSHSTTRLLLDRGAKIEARDIRGETPLLVASRSDHCSIVSLLLQRGAKIRATDHSGWTALHHVNGKCVATLRTLLVNGANLEKQDNRGRTPLLHASHCHGPDLVRLLIESGSDITATDWEGNTALLLALKRVAKDTSWDVKDIPDPSCHHDSLQTVDRLLDAHVDVNAENLRGFTALLFAARERSGAFVRSLLGRGATVEARIEVDGTTSDTPLTEAVSWDSVSSARLLLERGACVNSKDGRGVPALLVAIHSGSEDMVRLLLEAGADTNAVDGEGRDVIETSKLSDSWKMGPLIRKWVEDHRQTASEDTTGDRREDQQGMSD